MSKGRWLNHAGLAAGAAVLIGCSSAMQVHATNSTRCKEAPDPSMQPIPLTQSVEYLHSAHHDAYRGCITDIAAMQTVLTTGSNNQPQAVPADANCQYHDATTTVIAGAYTGTGARDTAAYGDGPGKQRGYVLARIENQGRCDTVAPFSIPAGAVVYWVVDRQNGDHTLRSHFIMQGTDDYLGGHAGWKIELCHHTNNSGDKAMVKVGDPCADYATTPAAFPPAGNSERQGPGPRAPAFRLRFDEMAMWIVCGTDCCYANGFEI